MRYGLIRRRLFGNAARIVLLMTAVISAVMLSGCWDYVEYENMALITAIGVDYEKESNQTTLTIEYMSSSPNKTSGGGGSNTSGGSSGNNSIVCSATDSTLYGAFSELQQAVMRKFFYGYLNIYLLGEEAAKYILDDQVEFLYRAPTIRNTAFLAVASGKAENVISTSNPYSESSSGMELYNMMNLIEYTGTAYPETIHDVLQLVSIEGIEAIIPRVETTARDKIPQSTGGSGKNIRYDEMNTGDVRIDGMAVFAKDRLTGWLDEKESRGVGCVVGKKIRSYQVSEIEGENSNEVLYFRITNMKSKITPEMSEGRPVVNVSVKVDADLRKYYTGESDEFINPENIREAEKKLERSLRDDIDAALYKCQKVYKSDVFGFGFEFFRKDPTLWRNELNDRWQDIYPTVDVNVNVEAHLLNTGTNIYKSTIK